MTDQEFCKKKGVKFLTAFGWQPRKARWCFLCKRRHKAGWFKVGSDQHEPISKSAAVSDELRSMAIAELIRQDVA